MAQREKHRSLHSAIHLQILPLVTYSNCERTHGIVTASDLSQERSSMPANEVMTKALEAGALNESRANSLEIFASIAIQAEVQRILYALSTPEYMGAWFQLPGAERVECHSEQRSFDRFRIDVFSSNRMIPTVYGSCLLSKPNRVTYLWEKDCVGLHSRSLVEIHLLGGPNRCTIKLEHRGLPNLEDREWHSTMWQLSLNKLRILMERIESTKWSRCHR